MRLIHTVFLSFFLIFSVLNAQANVSAGANNLKAETNKPEAVNLHRVRLETTMGNIVLELDSAKAPITTANFLRYVKDGFYDGLIFHRVIPNFMIQGGGMKPGMVKQPTLAPIKSEANNGLSNSRGTIAMARTSNPDSATAQFFINTVDNVFLDSSPSSAGYTVFGKVVEGMAAVDAIAKVKTTRQQGHSDVPQKDIIITQAVVVD